MYLHYVDCPAHGLYPINNGMDSPSPVFGITYHTECAVQQSPARSKRIFNIDIEFCSRCGGSVRVIADASDRCIEDEDIIDRILVHLREKEQNIPTLSTRVTGAYAEKMLLQESLVFPAPNGLSPDMAALITRGSRHRIGMK